MVGPYQVSALSQKAFWSGISSLPISLKHVKASLCVVKAVFSVLMAFMWFFSLLLKLDLIL